MDRLRLDYLHSFADVIELGSFSAAAQRRHLTQPAVSLQVRQLERQLGVRLIERVGRRATPTPAGLELLQHVRRIDAVVAGALEAMAFHATGTVGRVRLGTGATACIYLLPPVLHALRRKFPSLDIVVSTGNTQAILKSLEENLIDVALVTLPAPGRSLHVTPVVEDELVAIFPASTKSLPARMTPSALAELPLVAYEQGGNTRRLLDQWFARADISIKPTMELGNVEAIKELVGAGLGAGVLPRMAMTADSKKLLVARSLTPRLTRRLGVVLRHDKPLPRGLREVVQALTHLGKPRHLAD